MIHSWQDFDGDILVASLLQSRLHYFDISLWRNERIFSSVEGYDGTLYLLKEWDRVKIDIRPGPVLA